jgi:ketosteroid isomerase-like protein
MDETKRKDLIGEYIAAYNAFDIEGMAALLSPDVRFENYSGEARSHSTTGIDEFLQLAESSKSVFSEREQRIASLEFALESVFANIEFRGRLAVDMPDGPPAGTVLELKGTSEFSFENGQISKVIDRA